MNYHNFLSDILLVAFSLDYFFNFIFSFICFLQFFFIERPINFFTNEVANNACPYYSIFDFTNHKIFFRPIGSIAFSKNVLVLWNSYMITYFKLSIFAIRINILFSIWTRFNMNGLHFICSMTFVLVFIKNIIWQIKISLFWHGGHKLVNLIFSVLINL